MTKEKFDEVIDYAISGEKEAVKFYQELQQRTKFQAQKVMLKEFENMEKGHVVILENIRKKGIKNIRVKEVANLNISEYIVDVKPYDDMTYQDILIIAMKKEEQAQKLYANMAGSLPGTELETLFLKLASEEADHKLQFETLYDEHVLKEN
ncbi:MAG: ferritin family protein [Candidatus Cloacimonetes bacterium]|jgi:rubrerythrin|nr:ferritin family protein [Candidatus Cloacimonadota bacterium]MBT4332121.1 ferritin family protein [Candidatus Cloacimonadota bacterium]MBT4575244.1 ferritin family protein [Candidatus Cloacimonadota bacterium]MBT5419605.1 ferritin family protein [Candidatus Cloacimonadota bacterium]